MSNSENAASASGRSATNPFVRLVNELGVTRLSVIAAVTGGVILGVVYLSGQLTKPPMGLLFANLDSGDAAGITQQLEQRNIPFELKGDGSAIFVEQAKVLDLRMQLASQGLPAGQDVGYEIFDNESTFGQTSFRENLNRQRALEGELSRTIRALSKIEQARVHLALPQHELFSRDAKEPTASIVVKTRGYLDKETVGAIQHLVASAVEGLDPSNVSIVDERGTLLASGGKSTEEAMAMVGIDDTQAAYEERLRDQILGIVSKYTGTGNAQVQVAAELNFNRVTSQSTIYDPDTQVVASTTTTSETETSSDKNAPEQSVTVANSLPDNQNPTTTGSGTSSSSDRSRSEEQIAYQNSSTVRTEVSEPGKVLRLSVAVLVDGNYKTDDKGTKTYEPRAQGELDQIKEFIKAGIGFDEKRGDVVSVTNLPFAQISVPEGGEEKAPLLGLTKPDFIYIAQIAGLFILALVLLLLVIRPLLMNLFRTATGTAVAGGQLAAGVPGAMIASGGAFAAPASAGAPAIAQQPGQPMPRLIHSPGVGSQIDLAQIEGHVKDSSVKKVGEVVAHHPDESIAILRTWMQQAD